MPWSVGTSRFDSCTRLCDVRFAAYQLGLLWECTPALHHKWYQNADIRRSAKQTNIDSAIYI